MLNINKTVDKIFDDEKDKKFKNIIKKFLNGSVGILVALVIILLCSIFGLEFDWGIVDRDILIAVVPTILGGYFGFVGAVIGIMGAYLVLKEQLNNEVNKIKDKENIDLKMMKNLLEYTVSETDYIIGAICDRYSDLYSKYFGEEVLKLKFEKARQNIAPMIEHLICEKPWNDDAYLLHELYKDKDKEYKEIISKMVVNENDYINAYRNIYKSFNDIKDYKSLVYDKNWNSYLVAIKSNEKFSYEDIQAMIKWIGLINSNVVESNKDKVKLLEQSKVVELTRADFFVNVEMDKKIIEVEKELRTHIMDFISYRDKVITLIEDTEKFGEDVLSWEFESSKIQMTESIILTEKLENIIKKIDSN